MVSKAIGHGSISVTKGHYLKQSNDHIDRVIASLDGIGIRRIALDGIEVLKVVAANHAISFTPKIAEWLRVHCGT